MHGLMMDAPLLISSLVRHAAVAHRDQVIVSRTVEGPIHRYPFDELHRRAKRLANALNALEVKPGDRIGTIGWNGYRHMEIYFGVSGMGAVCHTLNPRLHPVQLDYIVNHAEDRYLFVDLTFVPLVETVAAELRSVRGIVIMTDRAHMPETQLPNVLCYEELLETQPDDFEWPAFDERTASSLCYTSGTSGNPKGVLYSHRSTLLHSYAIALPDALCLGESECILPVVPMFHVNAWGLPYAAALTGAKLVMPGAQLDGASLTELMTTEGVTMTAGVPTVWQGLLNFLRETGTTIPSLKRVVIGGSAAPRSMIEAFENEFGIEVRHAWGMTETSPLGTVSLPKPGVRGDEAVSVQCKQGRPVFGIELQIADEEGDFLPHDGRAFGELKVRGPWVASAYFDDESSTAHDDQGWFATGDVATIDPDAYMQITDRRKDLIKSGGEWISSIELENLAVAHPGIAQAAVIAIPDVKWDERPLLVAVPGEHEAPTADGLKEYLVELVPRFWVPDRVVFVDRLPIGPTGKVLKRALREQYANAPNEP